MREHITFMREKFEDAGNVNFLIAICDLLFPRMTFERLYTFHQQEIISSKRCL